MTFTLYRAIVPQYQQMLGSMIAIVGTSEAWCEETGTDPADLLATRLIDDMQPLSYQFKSIAVHSKGAIAGVRKGSFRPDTAKPPSSFAAVTKLLEAAREEVDALTPDEVESFVGRKMQFVVRFAVRDFTADRFLLSFSQLNFLFHVSMAYGLLRMRGVDIGKRDYLGVLQTESPRWRKIGDPSRSPR
jgi:hypothetical protein